MIRLVLLLLFVAAIGARSAQAQTVPAPDCKPGDASAAGEPRALALLVGVGDYPTTGNVTPISKLRGPPNDVEIMRDMLVKKGIEAANIKILLDSQATRAAIIAAFCDHLVKPARAQDSILFYFSGHGSQTGDQEPLDEPDGLDETIVAYDSRQPGVVDIRDDELQALVRQLPTSNVVLILDSCNSGTSSKDAFGVARKVEADPRQPPPAGARGGAVNNGFASDPTLFVLFAGTRSDRLSYESSFTRGDQSVIFGAMTYHLVREFGAATDATYRELFEQIVPQVKALFSLQEPQLEGANADNILFKNINVLTNPYVEVAKDGDVVTMKAGAVHNVTKGSRYDVFPPRAREFTDDKRIARIEVVEANPLQSVAKILEGTITDAASRAVERVHKFSGKPLRVATGDDQAFTQQIKQALGADAGAIEFVRADPTASLALRTNEAPAAKQVAWHSPDGNRMSPWVPRNSASAAADVARHLQQWAKWFAIQKLSNPQSKLKAAVSLTKVGAGKPADGELILKAGEKFQITVQNKSEVDVFVHVIDLSSDGSITPIFPSGNAQERLQPNHEWTSDEYKTSLVGGAEQVSDTARVLLTTEPIPIGMILQPGIKAIPALPPKDPENDLASLLANGAIGARQFGSTNVDDWKTFDRRLRVVK